MTSRPNNGFHFRDIKLAAFYGADKSDRYTAAKTDLHRYRLLMTQALKTISLTKEEAIAVWSALNGCNTSHTDMLPILQQGIISELIEDGKAELAQKVKNWSTCQWVAVVDACDRVGRDSYKIEDLKQELEKVGLIEVD